MRITIILSNATSTASGQYPWRECKKKNKQKYLTHSHILRVTSKFLPCTPREVQNIVGNDIFYSHGGNMALPGHCTALWYKYVRNRALLLIRDTLPLRRPRLCMRMTYTIIKERNFFYELWTWTMLLYIRKSQVQRFAVDFANKTIKVKFVMIILAFV